MRVDLALELQISVLGHVCLFPLALHLIVRHDGVVYHVYDAVYGYLGDHGNAEEKDEIGVFHTHHEGFQQGCKNHECDVKQRCSGFRAGAFPRRHGPDEKNVDADEDDQREGIRHHPSYHVDDVVLVDVRP